MIGRDGASPEWADLIADAIESRLLNVHVSTVGIIVSYDAATQTASVQPAVRRPVPRADGTNVHEPWPTIPNVPVLFPGAASYSQHWPLAAGDAVDLVFQDYSIAGWRGSGRESDARDTEHHGPSYPIAVPWMRPSGGPGPDTDGPSAGRPGGLRVYYGEATVDVGKGAGVAAVAMSTLVDAALTALKAAIASAATTEAGAGGLGGMTALNAALSAWPAGSVASTNLRAK